MVWEGATVPYQQPAELTDAQLRNLIERAQPIQGVGGCELLDDDDNVVADISDYLTGATITYTADATVTRTATIQLEDYELDWATKPRLRLYQTLSGEWQGETLSKRFDRGVYIITGAPDIDPGSSPIRYDLDGMDKCHLLQRYMAQSAYFQATSGYVAVGVELLEGLRDVEGMPLGRIMITASTEAELLTLPADMCWLADEETRWYQVASDIFTPAGMLPPFADEQGRICSRMNDTLSTAPLAWTLDVDDEATSIVSRRVKSVDAFDADVNYRVYLQANWNSVTPPAEGTGIYTIDDGINPHVPRRYMVDAADQTTLETKANQMYAEEKARVESLRIETVCWPELVHKSVVSVTDRALGGTFRGRIKDATLPLNLEDGPVSLTLDLVQ